MSPQGSEKVLAHILLVDEEVHISDLLQYNLKSEQYELSVVAQAREAVRMDLSNFHLMLIDTMNQDFSGLDLLRSVKASAHTAHIPVIILAYSDSEDDKLRAFDAGADDYVLKPFSLRELLARIRSVLRRNPIGVKTHPQSMILSFGSLTIDLLTRSVRVDARPISLTKTEYAILTLLAQNRGRVFSRHEIYDEIWRDIDRGNNERIVDTNISRLRKKLSSASVLIGNKSGYGYYLGDNNID